MATKKAAFNPFESMLIGLITSLSEAGAEVMFQKIIDRDKKKAKIVLGTLKAAIEDVAAANKIKL